MVHLIYEVIKDAAKRMLISDRAAHPVLASEAGMEVARLVAGAGYGEKGAHEVAAWAIRETGRLHATMERLRAGKALG